jgi:hypothetical protein
VEGELGVGGGAFGYEEEGAGVNGGSFSSEEETGDNSSSSQDSVTASFFLGFKDACGFMESLFRDEERAGCVSIGCQVLVWLMLKRPTFWFCHFNSFVNDPEY